MNVSIVSIIDTILQSARIVARLTRLIFLISQQNLLEHVRAYLLLLLTVPLSRFLGLLSVRSLPLLRCFACAVVSLARSMVLFRDEVGEIHTQILIVTLLLTVL